MSMRFLGTPVEGYARFLERHDVTLAEPPELRPDGPAARES